MILEEIERIRTQPVTDKELEVSKNTFLETFPRTFESRAGTLAVFVGDEWTSRPADYWKTYRDKIRAVTAADIQRVAAEHLLPEKMAIMIVGKWDEIASGDPEGRASMAAFFGGKHTELALRDPLTMRPMQ